MRDAMASRPNPPAGSSRRVFLAGAGLIAAGTASALAIRRGDEAGWRADVVVAEAGSYDLDLSPDHPRRPGGAGPWASLGSRQVGPAQAKPGRAVEDGSADQHQPGGGPGRRRGFSRVGGSRGLRGRRAGALPGHRLRSRTVRPRAGPRRGGGSSSLTLTTTNVFSKANPRGFTDLASLFLPVSLRRADLVVSLPKLKTHHWAGVTLAMKNLFGVMPGVVYGWPQERPCTHAGIPGSILDNQRGRQAVAGDRRRDHRHGGGRADHGHSASSRGPRDGDELAQCRRQRRPG